MFWMQTVTEYSAGIALDQTSVTLRLPDLEYLVLNLNTLANQMARYNVVEADVTAYVQSAAGAKAFIPPAESACLFVNVTYS
jgi:hypothetical protein